jgi:hypothetical protein
VLGGQLAHRDDVEVERHDRQVHVDGVLGERRGLFDPGADP